MQLIEDYITAEGKAVMNAGADMNNVIIKNAQHYLLLSQ